MDERLDKGKRERQEHTQHAQTAQEDQLQKSTPLPLLLLSYRRILFSDGFDMA
jgi:hypothetical protein